MPRPISGLTGAYIRTTGNGGFAGAASSSTEGKDKLTYLVPKTGLYRVSGAVIETTASGTAANIDIQCAHNNGSAIAAANITPVGLTPTVLAANSVVGAANSWITREQLVYAIAGTSIVLTVASSAIATAFRYTVMLQVTAV